jgi:hypothetical protein
MEKYRMMGEHLITMVTSEKRKVCCAFQYTKLEACSTLAELSE